jgi:Na+-driven multidrug efflux pump
VLGIALPAIGSNLLRLLVTTVDMIMVGRLGYIQIAAVGTSNILIFLFQGIMMAIANGSMIVVANYFGKKNMKRQARFFQNLYGSV